MALILSGDTGPSFVQRAAMPAGSVLQTVQAVLTTPFSVSMSGNYVWVDITGLSLSITPTSATSKIMLMGEVQNGTNDGGTWMFRFARNGTGVGIGTSAADLQAGTGTWTYGTYPNYTLVPCTWQFLDSPATTSAITYKVQISGDMGTATCQINKRGNDTRFACISSITAMEIAV